LLAVSKVDKTPAALSRTLIRRITKDSARPNELRDAAFRRRILSIPKGKVATYGQVAAASGYPLYHRAVARLLRTTAAHLLPWQRVVGSGGQIKLRFEAAAEQRLLLEMEGVKFLGRRVDLNAHQHAFGAWDPEDMLMSENR
jgi:methylated-DNA-protein-cysteine methyltransferase related protein